MIVTELYFPLGIVKREGTGSHVGLPPYGLVICVRGRSESWRRRLSMISVCSPGVSALLTDSADVRVHT